MTKSRKNIHDQPRCSLRIKNSNNHISMSILIEFSSHGEHLHLLHIQTICHLSMCCTTIRREPILISTIVHAHGQYQLEWIANERRRERHAQLMRREAEIEREHQIRQQRWRDWYRIHAVQEEDGWQAGMRHSISDITTDSDS